jgi:hypothetical protein
MLCGPTAETGRSPPGASATARTRDQTPCAATWYPMRRQLDNTLVEARLSAGEDSVLTARPRVPGAPEALAIAGKTLWGSRQQGALAAHRLSVLSHRMGLPRWPQAVADMTQAIPLCDSVLAGFVIAGRGLSVDAVLTQRPWSPRCHVRCGSLPHTVWQPPPGDGRVAPHRPRLEARGRGDGYRSGLSPLCSAAMGGLSPDRDQTRQLNDSGWYALALIKFDCSWYNQLSF